MKVGLLWIPLGLCACASALEEGERRYRQGDRRGALEVWRSVAEGDAEHAAVRERISVVAPDLARLAVSYIESARALEETGRLAESILDYRLALALEPDDAETLAHVQALARELEARKASLHTAYAEDLAQGDLEAARESLQRLRGLDPFDPEYETEERQLQAALRVEWRRREARIRAQLAGELDTLVEAGREAFGHEQLETALGMWRRALLIDPDNERVQAYISRAERQLERLERLRAEPRAKASE